MQKWELISQAANYIADPSNKFEWGDPGCCVVGVLARFAMQTDKPMPTPWELGTSIRSITDRMEKKGKWEDEGGYCPHWSDILAFERDENYYSFPTRCMMEMGFTVRELQHAEYLSDPRVKQKMKGRLLFGRAALSIRRKTVKYLRAWAMLERDLEAAKERMTRHAAEALVPA